jgi:hypothetical protein
MTTPTIIPYPDGTATVPMVQSTNPVGGHLAIPVYNMGTLKDSQGAGAVQVLIITDADLTANGGQYDLEARTAALPVTFVSNGVPIQGGAVIPVYVVNP